MPLFRSIILLKSLVKLKLRLFWESSLAFWLALFASANSSAFIIWLITSFTSCLPCLNISSPFNAKILSRIFCFTAATLDLLRVLVLPNNLSCFSEINLEFKTIPNPFAILFNLRLKILSATFLEVPFSSTLIAFSATASANSIPVWPIDCWCSPIICSELAIFWSFSNSERPSSSFLFAGFFVSFVSFIKVLASLKLVWLLFILSWPSFGSPLTTTIPDFIE